MTDGAQAGSKTTSGVEVARAAYDAWARSDVDALVGIFSEDTEIHPFLGSVPGASVYHGSGGVRRWYADATESWQELVIDPHEFKEIDDRVVIFLRVTAVGLGSQARVDASIVHVAQFSEGRISRLEGYADREAMQRALGVDA